MSTLQNLYKKAKDFVSNIQPEKVARSVFMNTTPFGSLERTFNDTRNPIGNFFKPTEQLRIRDVVREMPGNTWQGAKTFAQDATRFGISAIEAPQTLRTGQASGKFYNTPFGKLNSFQSEAQNRVQRGDPLWKAIGNPAMDTLLGASDFAAIAKPVLSAAKNFNHFGALGKEISALAGDLTVPLGKTMKLKIPARTEMVSPNIFDANPNRGTFKIIDGKAKKVAGFQMRRNAVPTQIPEQVVDVPFEFQSKTLTFKPGMTIKTGKVKNDLIMSQHGAEVYQEMLNAKAGQRIPIKNDGEVSGMLGEKSSFPQWIPEELKSRDLLDKVQKHLLDGTEPETARVKRLYDVAVDEMANRAGVQFLKTESPLVQESRKSIDIEKEFNALSDTAEKRYKEYWKKNPTQQQTAENHSPSTFLTVDEQSKLQNLGGELERTRLKERGILSQKDLKDIVQLKRNLRKENIPFNENLSKQELTDIWNKANGNPAPTASRIESLPNRVDLNTEPIQQTTKKGLLEGKKHSIPSQSNFPEEISYPKSSIGSIESKPLLLSEGKYTASTPKEAKKLFKKTGRIPVMNFSKNGSGVIEQVSEGQKYTPIPKDIEEVVLGRKSYVPQAGKEAGSYIQKARGAQEWIDNQVSKMASSQNMLVRGTARFLQGFAGQLGKNQDSVTQLGKYKGGIDYGRELANDAAQKVYAALPDEAALKRVHSNLDPELYGGKMEKLSPQEQEVTSYLRQISDWINDTNFSNGFISPEQWSKGRGGKYLARAYEAFDYPPEVADVIKQSSAKMDLGMFKKREGLTDWKQEEAIRDPAYLVGKRLQQTIFNDTTSKMFSWLKGQNDFVSEKAKAGFTQISEHKAFGELSGKYVRNDILEDIKGFFFTHKIADDAYKLLRAYGRNPVRRGLKATKTVLNPVTRLGNRVGNFLFAHLSGINPATFAKNQLKAYELIKTKDPLVTRMIKDGMLGTDFSKGEIVDASVDIVRNNKKGMLRKGWESIADSYGRTDDAAKVAAMKTFLDRGFSYEEASKKVAASFQNYRTVGKFYDIGANMPVLGNAFIRFQADLQRILKNAVVEHPVRSLGTVMAIKLFGDVMSMASGETPEEKQVRENRVGSPHIPYTDISMAFQTPWGEVNASRWLGVFANTPVGGSSAATDASKLAPIQNPMEKRNYGSDVMIGPVVGAAIDTDFRGKSIQDPNQSKYKPSTLTTGEKALNVAKYEARSYNLPVLNDLIDVWSAANGKEDFYGRKKSVGQSVAKLAGVKVEQYGSKEVAAQQLRDREFAQYKKDDVKKMINSVLKDQQAGKIDEATAQKRIQNLQNKLETPAQSGSVFNTAKAENLDSRITPNPSGGFSYTDSNGDFKTAKTKQLAEIAIAKMELADSDKNILKINGKVLRKTADGEVQVTSEDKYNTQLYTAKLATYKRNKDVKSWLATAEKKYSALQKQLKDPNTDELDKATIQDDMDVLEDQYAKYRGYGGFNKPKTGKKKTPLKLSLTKLSPPKPIKTTTPKISMALPKSLNLKSIQPKRISIKKPTYKPSVAPSMGKRLA